jgi:integrase
MGRPKKQNREPFWFADRNSYYVHHGSKKHRLSPDKDEAWRLWHEMMARPPEVRKVLPSGPSALVVEILDAFLEWSQTNQAEKTYRWYRDHVQNFAKAISPKLTVTEMKPYHVTQAMDAHPGWSASTKNGFARAIQRGMRWAEKQGLIDRTPIQSVEKPQPENREVYIPPEEFTALLSRFPDQEFRDLLTIVWETGCRPQEAFAVEARHVDLDNSRWVFKIKESKGKRQTRSVYLSEQAMEVTRRLMEKHPTGKLFKNEDGEPWKKNAVNCRFVRKKKALGKKLCLYHLRHSFAQRMLLAGVDSLVVSQLLGHRDGAMLARVYSHLQQEPAFLTAKLKQGNA